MSLLSDSQLQRYRLPLVLVACLQAFFGSGIFYGWAALYSLLLEMGVYRDRCEGDEPTCSEQKERLTFIYTVASSVNLCSQLPWGCILDFLGPRVCNLWSTTLVIVGFILLSLSARGVMDAYMMAMCLIAGAGPGAQISLFHLSELFLPKQKSTVLSVVTGAFQLGFVVFMLFQLAHTYLGLSLSDLALDYCIPLGILLLFGGVLWPDYPCIPPDDLDPLSFTSRRPSQPGMIHYEKRSLRHGADRSHSPIWNQQVVISEQEGTPNPVNPQTSASEESQPIYRNVNVYSSASAADHSEYGSIDSSSPSIHNVHRTLHALRVSRSNPNLKGAAASKGFLHQLLAPSYLICLAWMCICLFWANFYIGTVVEQLNVKSSFDLDVARRYTQIFTICLPMGILGIGMFGYLTDVLGFSTSIACTSCFAVGFAASALYLPLGWQPLTFVLYSFFRSFLFSVMFSYLANEFGYRHFGLLSGIMLAVSGGLCLLQVPLQYRFVQHDPKLKTNNSATEEYHEDVAQLYTFVRFVNQIQLASLAATFFFAVYVFFRQKSRAQRVEAQIQQHQQQLQTANTF